MDSTGYGTGANCVGGNGTTAGSFVTLPPLRTSSQRSTVTQTPLKSSGSTGYPGVTQIDGMAVSKPTPLGKVSRNAPLSASGALLASSRLQGSLSKTSLMSGGGAPPRAVNAPAVIEPLPKATAINPGTSSRAIAPGASGPAKGIGEVSGSLVHGKVQNYNEIAQSQRTFEAVNYQNAIALFHSPTMRDSYTRLASKLRSIARARSEGYVVEELMHIRRLIEVTIDALTRAYANADANPDNRGLQQAKWSARNSLVPALTLLIQLHGKPLHAIMDNSSLNTARSTHRGQTPREDHEQDCPESDDLRDIDVVVVRIQGSVCEPVLENLSLLRSLLSNPVLARYDEERIASCILSTLSVFVQLHNYSMGIAANSCMKELAKSSKLQQCAANVTSAFLPSTTQVHASSSTIQGNATHALAMTSTSFPPPSPAVQVPTGANRFEVGSQLAGSALVLKSQNALVEFANVIIRRGKQAVAALLSAGIAENEYTAQRALHFALITAGGAVDVNSDRSKHISYYTPRDGNESPSSEHDTVDDSESIFTAARDGLNPAWCQSTVSLIASYLKLAQILGKTASSANALARTGLVFDVLTSAYVPLFGALNFARDESMYSEQSNIAQLLTPQMIIGSMLFDLAFDLLWILFDASPSSAAKPGDERKPPDASIPSMYASPNSIAQLAIVLDTCLRDHRKSSYREMRNNIAVLLSRIATESACRGLFALPYPRLFSTAPHPSLETDTMLNRSLISVVHADQVDVPPRLTTWTLLDLILSQATTTPSPRTRTPATTSHINASAASTSTYAHIQLDAEFLTLLWSFLVPLSADALCAATIANSNLIPLLLEYASSRAEQHVAACISAEANLSSHQLNLTLTQQGLINVERVPLVERWGHHIFRDVRRAALQSFTLLCPRFPAKVAHCKATPRLFDLLETISGQNELMCLVLSCIREAVMVDREQIPQDLTPEHETELITEELRRQSILLGVVQSALDTPTDASSDEQSQSQRGQKSTPGFMHPDGTNVLPIHALRGVTTALQILAVQLTPSAAMSTFSVVVTGESQGADKSELFPLLHEAKRQRFLMRGFRSRRGLLTLVSALSPVSRLASLTASAPGLVAIVVDLIWHLTAPSCLLEDAFLDAQASLVGRTDNREVSQVLNTLESILDDVQTEIKLARAQLIVLNGVERLMDVLLIGPHVIRKQVLGALTDLATADLSNVRSRFLTWSPPHGAGAIPSVAAAASVPHFPIPLESESRAIKLLLAHQDQPLDNGMLDTLPEASEPHPGLQLLLYIWSQQEKALGGRGDALLTDVKDPLLLVHAKRELSRQRKTRGRSHQKSTVDSDDELSHTSESEASDDEFGVSSNGGSLDQSYEDDVNNGNGFEGIPDILIPTAFEKNPATIEACASAASWTLAEMFSKAKGKEYEDSSEGAEKTRKTPTLPSLKEDLRAHVYFLCAALELLNSTTVGPSHRLGIPPPPPPPSESSVPPSLVTVTGTRRRASHVTATANLALSPTAAAYAGLLPTPRSKELLPQTTQESVEDAGSAVETYEPPAQHFSQAGVVQLTDLPPIETDNRQTPDHFASETPEEPSDAPSVHTLERRRSMVMEVEQEYAKSDSLLRLELIASPEQRAALEAVAGYALWRKATVIREMLAPAIALTKLAHDVPLDEGGGSPGELPQAVPGVGDTILVPKGCAPIISLAVNAASSLDDTHAMAPAAPSTIELDPEDQAWIELALSNLRKKAKQVQDRQYALYERAGAIAGSDLDAFLASVERKRTQITARPTRDRLGRVVYGSHWNPPVSYSRSKVAPAAITNTSEALEIDSLSNDW